MVLLVNIFHRKLALYKHKVHNKNFIFHCDMYNNQVVLQLLDLWHNAVWSMNTSTSGVVSLCLTAFGIGHLRPFHVPHDRPPLPIQIIAFVQHQKSTSHNTFFMSAISQEFRIIHHWL